ncbi:MAG: DNA-binding response regulator [Chloroflexi bacterium RBG_13_46_14]|nr:MAG: DNA-binding response regulator [Chloroflexi bacterium RBG_13_46_14]
MMTKKTRILIADDEPKIRMFLRANLNARGYEVHLAQDGLEAVEMAGQVLPDLIILDVNMPRMNGIDACRRIREWADMPIIILSVRDEEKDKVRALDEGADDYVTKPFGMEELLARMRVALRRTSRATIEIPVFRAGNLKIDFTSRLVSINDKEIKLTRTEYELLAYLANNAGKVLTHREILHSVWGPEYGDELEYVRTFINQLRRKIEEDQANPRYIITEQRIGYRFVKPS